MAAITAGQCTSLFTEGSAEKVLLYRVSKVSTADTLDFGSAGLNVLTQVKCCAWVPAGVRATAVAAVLSGGPPTTIATFTLAGLASDEIYVVVIGQV